MFLAWLLHSLCRGDAPSERLAGLALIVVATLAHMLTGVSGGKIDTSPLQIKPELPLVAANPISFLEVDFNEPLKVARRLYYLTDSRAASQWHYTESEGFGDLRLYYPVKGTVCSYQSFTHEHSHFLVFGTPGGPEQWLLTKLQSAGAAIRRVAHFENPYHDSDLFEVVLSASR
jgi:hypothetical protein